MCRIRGTVLFGTGSNQTKSKEQNPSALAVLMDVS